MLMEMPMLCTWNDEQTSNALIVAPVSQKKLNLCLTYYRLDLHESELC